MKSPHLFIALIVAASSIAGAGIASHYRVTPGPIAQSQPPAPVPPPTPPQATPSEPYQPIAPTPNPPATQPSDRAGRRPVTLNDWVQWGSEFYQFRENLRQAVRDRDINFIKSLIPPGGVTLGYGRPQTSEELNLDNPQAPFWTILEKAVVHGCDERPTGDYPMVDRNSQVWLCPNIMRAFLEQYPPPATAEGVSYEMANVIVVGQSVNVRAQANPNSAVLGTLSNEVVQFDQATWTQMVEAGQLQPAATIEGWTPIILPDGQRGFVANRYAYHPLENRLVLGQIKGLWQLLEVPGGD